MLVLSRHGHLLPQVSAATIPVGRTRNRSGRMRLVIALSLAFVAAGGCWGTSGSSIASAKLRMSAISGPPPGLGAAAITYWNVDALVRDKFGHVQVCVRNSNVIVRATSTFCGVHYVPLFPTARHSQFRLAVLARNPLDGLNVVPIRFYGPSGPYVSCGNGRWLALTNARSELWPVTCVRR